MREKAIFFIHIPKTAGTTLYRIIERNYHRHQIYTIWQDGSPADFKQLHQTARANIRMLRGHAGFGLGRYLPQPTAHFTILRDPIDRLISYYYFVRRTPHHYCHDLVTSRDMSLEAFIHSQADFMADNAQTRLLSGLETGQEVPFGHCTGDMLDAAKQNLRDNMTVVGLTEAFDATLLLLKRAFGWEKLTYAQQNVSTKRVKKESLSPAAREAVIAANGLDDDLYQYATALFDEQTGQQGPSFARDVETFQAANRRLSPLLYAYWSARKISVRTIFRQLMERIMD